MTKTTKSADIAHNLHVLFVHRNLHLQEKGFSNFMDLSKTSSKYDSIIHLPHHVSKTHPPMPISDRAAQFSPFAALTGHDAAIRETARLTTQRMELEEDEQYSINETLQNIVRNQKDRPEISLVYYLPDAKKEGGAYLECIGTVKKVDLYHRVVLMEDSRSIKIDDIIQIHLLSFQK